MYSGTRADLGTRTDLGTCSDLSESIQVAHTIHASVQAHLQKTVPRNVMYMYRYVSSAVLLWVI